MRLLIEADKIPFNIAAACNFAGTCDPDCQCCAVGSTGPSCLD